MLIELKPLRLASPDDPALAALASLFGTEWTGFSPALLYAKYAGNPFAPTGAANFVAAYSGGELVAANGYIPARYRAGDTTLLGVQDCDSFVRADWRGKGVFSRIVAWSEEHYRAAGCDFLYGFPNENSFRAYEKAGWTIGRLVEYTAKPVVPILERLALSAADRKGLVVEPVAVAALPGGESRHDGGALELDLGGGYARWRFAEERGDYEAWRVRDREGRIAWAVTRRDGGRGIRIMSVGGDTNLLPFALRAAILGPSGERLAIACHPVDHARARAFRLAGFLGPRITSLVKRRTMRLVYKNFNSGTGDLSCLLDLQYADYDTV